MNKSYKVALIRHMLEADALEVDSNVHNDTNKYNFDVHI